MAKAETSTVDPRVKLAELERFVASEKERLLPAVAALETAERAKAEKAEAEKLEVLRSEAVESAEYLVKLAARIDAAMKALADLLQERDEAGAEFTRQYDRKVVFVGHTFAHPGLVDSALHHAGIGRFAHIRSRGAQSLEYVDRQRLNGLVKPGA
ncbi:hypothetical protein FHT72_004553 [Rhizobium sp. BK077]|uniref:hypothetical protein n=1 Tax=unclassified Rhizobium TaxID=2613769 RepID=UPI00160EBE81|nr:MULTISPECIES: hypothetical protein [unclassified Rhizobium]MBB3300905.1 hypothetical protein [Rhizobium sp. BK112]MBB3370045.1 hypothetical protein [Rhizobium sp. BK077]MBB4180795.1 hypothetical protein [Rhizobium sp. BK109]